MRNAHSTQYGMSIFYLYNKCIVTVSVVHQSLLLTPFIILRRKHTKLLYEMLTNVLGSLNPTISDISKNRVFMLHDKRSRLTHPYTTNHFNNRKLTSFLNFPV